MTGGLPSDVDRSGTVAPGALRARAMAAIGAAICVLTLSGWASGHDLLTRFVPGLPSMKVNTAIAFLLLSGTVWRIGAGAQDRLPVAALLAMGLASLTALQWVTGSDFAIDNALLRDLQTAPTDHPGRMAAATSLALVLLGSGVLLRRRRNAGRWRHRPTLLALAIAYVASIGLLLGTRWPGWSAVLFGSVSLPTATLTLLLGSALLALDEPARADDVGDLRRGAAAGRLARRCLPVAILLPVLMAWALEVATRKAQIPIDTARALAFSTLGLAYGAMVLGAASWIGRLEATLRASEDSLAARVAQRTEQLARAEQAAELARRRLAHVLARAEVGIVAVDAHHRVVVFNGAAERMFGVSAADIVGQPLDRLMPAALRGAHDDWMRGFETQPGAARAMGRPGREVHGLRSDGTTFVLEASIVGSDDGGERLLTAVLRDLTVPLALEDERRARERAESANRAKSEQLGQISHELKTPLNAVIGFSSLMLDAPPTTGERDATERKWIGLIRSAGQHMLRMINDLTELSRVDAGQSEVSLTAVDAAAVAASVRELTAGLAAEAGVDIAVGPASTPVWVRADEHRLRQVLLNLASNAIKYNRPGGEVRLRAVPLDERDAAVHVEDTGLGLDAAQQAHLFEPFNRLGRDASGIEGSGLGLVLSRGLVQAMGGRLEVASEAGRGSTFSVVLPRTDA